MPGSPSAAAFFFTGATAPLVPRASFSWCRLLVQAARPVSAARAVVAIRARVSRVGVIS